MWILPSLGAVLARPLRWMGGAWGMAPMDARIVMQEAQPLDVLNVYLRVIIRIDGSG